METILLIFHLIVVLALIGLILLQPSDSEGFGSGTSSSSFMKSTGATNNITRVTAILGLLFFLTSIGLSLLARYYTASKTDLLNRIENSIVPDTKPVSQPVPPVSSEKNENIPAEKSKETKTTPPEDLLPDAKSITKPK